MNEDKVKEVLKSGSEITGSAVGGAIGFFLGGPLGGAAAGAIGSATGNLLADVAMRIMSRRESIRVGATAQYAYDQIQRNIDAGRILRRDKFADARFNERSPRDELFEGVLLRAQREHEEKKLKYLGQFFGNLAFEWNCSAEQANYLLGLFERLTYQQLVMIRTFRPLNLREIRITREKDEGFEPWEKELIGARKEEQRVLRSGLRKRMQTGGITHDRYAAYGALMELFQLSVVAQLKPSGLRDAPPSEMTEIDFARTFSITLGERLHDLCGLEGIPLEDVAQLKIALDYESSLLVNVDHTTGKVMYVATKMKSDDDLTQ